MVKPIEECAMPVPTSEEMEPQLKEPFLKFFMNLAGKIGAISYIYMLPSALN
jgi:hypothetical protein